MRATGIDRLTTGPGPDAGVAVSTDGRRLAFTAKSQRIRTWLFPFDATAGHIKGSGEAITSPGRMSVDPTLSPDGAKVAYVVPHGEGNEPAIGDVRNELWVKSLLDGSEVPVISDDYSRWFPRWSPGQQATRLRASKSQDERATAHAVVQPKPRRKASGQQSRASGIGLQTASGCWRAQTREESGWSRSLQHRMRKLRRKRLFRPIRRTTSTSHSFLLTADGLCLRRWRTRRRWRSRRCSWYQPRVVRGGGLPTASIGTTNRAGLPMGRRFILFLGAAVSSISGGSTSIPLVGKTVGEPFQVSKFESARLMVPRFIPPVGLSLTQDKLVLTMAEESGGIWVLENVDR